MDFIFSLESTQTNNDDQRPERILTFKNYVPKSIPLRNKEPTAIENVSRIHKRILDSSKKIIKDFNQEDKMINIVPKKTTNDLKKLISKKQSIAQKRTEKALIKMLRKKSSLI